MSFCLLMEAIPTFKVKTNLGRVMGFDKVNIILGKDQAFNKKGNSFS